MSQFIYTNTKTKYFPHGEDNINLKADIATLTQSAE